MRMKVGEFSEGLCKGHFVCDVCKHEEIFDIPENISEKDLYLTSKYDEFGWSCVGGVDHCPACIGKSIDDFRENRAMHRELFQDHCRELPPGDAERELFGG